MKLRLTPSPCGVTHTSSTISSICIRPRHSSCTAGASTHKSASAMSTPPRCGQPSSVKVTLASKRRARSCHPTKNPSSPSDKSDPSGRRQKLASPPRHAIVSSPSSIRPILAPRAAASLSNAPLRHSARATTSPGIAEAKRAAQRSLSPCCSAGSCRTLASSAMRSSRASSAPSDVSASAASDPSACGRSCATGAPRADSHSTTSPHALASVDRSHLKTPRAASKSIQLAPVAVSSQ